MLKFGTYVCLLLIAIFCSLTCKGQGPNSTINFPFQVITETAIQTNNSYLNGLSLFRIQSKNNENWKIPLQFRFVYADYWYELNQRGIADVNVSVDFDKFRTLLSKLRERNKLKVPLNDSYSESLKTNEYDSLENKNKDFNLRKYNLKDSLPKFSMDSTKRWDISDSIVNFPKIKGDSLLSDYTDGNKSKIIEKASFLKRPTLNDIKKKVWYEKGAFPYVKKFSIGQIRPSETTLAIMQYQMQGIQIIGGFNKLKLECNIGSGTIGPSIGMFYRNFELPSLKSLFELKDYVMQLNYDFNKGSYISLGWINTSTLFKNEFLIYPESKAGFVGFGYKYNKHELVGEFCSNLDHLDEMKTVTLLQNIKSYYGLNLSYSFALAKTMDFKTSFSYTTPQFLISTNRFLQSNSKSITSNFHCSGKVFDFSLIPNYSRIDNVSSKNEFIGCSGIVVFQPSISFQVEYIGSTSINSIGHNLNTINSQQEIKTIWYRKLPKGLEKFTTGLSNNNIKYQFSDLIVQHDSYSILGDFVLKMPKSSFSISYTGQMLNDNLFGFGLQKINSRFSLIKGRSNLGLSFCVLRNSAYDNWNCNNYIMYTIDCPKNIHMELNINVINDFYRFDFKSTSNIKFIYSI